MANSVVRRFLPNQTENAVGLLVEVPLPTLHLNSGAVRKRTDPIDNCEEYRLHSNIRWNEKVYARTEESFV